MTRASLEASGIKENILIIDLIFFLFSIIPFPSLLNSLLIINGIHEIWMETTS